MTLAKIVTDYIREFRNDARAEMRFFENQRSPSAAIRKAGLCIPSGKRRPHQRRIPKAVLEQAEARLQAIGRSLAKAADFDDLHRLVEHHIGGIHGVRALTVYDIAHRLGAYFGKAPELVYLHAGTKTGARAFKISGDSVHPRNLPDAFSRLQPAEIEDCLCIYKDDLRNRPRAHAARRARCISV